MTHAERRRFLLDVEKRGEVMVLRPEGGCDHECAAAMDGIISHTDGSGRRNIILDASRLEYVETPGFRWMLRTGRDLQAAGGTLIVAGLIGSAERAFQLLQLNRSVQVAISVDAAFALIWQPGTI